MIKDMVMGSFFGLMEQYIKEIGSLELNMAKDSFGCQTKNIKREFSKIINLKLQFKIRPFN